MLIFKGKNRVTSGFRLPDRPDHNGMDIVGDNNPDVHSVVDGVVKSSTKITDKSNPTWEWGNYVRIDDSKGNRFYYCHLKSRSVKVGQKVNQGDKIGVMGNTGYSFGAHTHFEVRDKTNTPINPAPFLGIANERGIFEAEADGWFLSTKGDWQYRRNGIFVKNDWILFNDWWYWLGADAVMLTGLQTIKGKLYYLNEKASNGVPLGACIITDKNGVVKR